MCCVCAFLCERERERQSERVRRQERERERERQRDRETEGGREEGEGEGKKCGGRRECVACYSFPTVSSLSQTIQECLDARANHKQDVFCPKPYLWNEPLLYFCGHSPIWLVLFFLR